MYELTRRYLVKGQLVGLELREVGGGSNPKILKQSDIHTLIKKSLISNCSLLEEAGEEFIITNGFNLSDLPIIQPTVSPDKELRLVARIEDETGLIGYQAQTNTEQTVNLDKNQVWERARANQIVNATASVYRDKRLIKGKNIHLRELPKITL